MKKMSEDRNLEMLLERAHGASVPHVPVPLPALLDEEEPTTSLFHSSCSLPWLGVQRQKYILSHHSDHLEESCQEKHKNQAINPQNQPIQKTPTNIFSLRLLVNKITLLS